MATKKTAEEGSYEAFTPKDNSSKEQRRVAENFIMEALENGETIQRSPGQKPFIIGSRKEIDPKALQHLLQQKKVQVEQSSHGGDPVWLYELTRDVQIKELRVDDHGIHWLDYDLYDGEAPLRRWFRSQGYGKLKGMGTRGAASKGNTIFAVKYKDSVTYIAATPKAKKHDTLKGLKAAEGEHDKQLRPFEKTDWYGWAGAENFEDGSEPLIAWVSVASWPDEGVDYAPEEGVKDAAVIVDKNGISVNGFNASFDMPSKGNKDAMIQTANDVIRNGPIDFQRLLERGFVPVNFPNEDDLKPKTAPVTVATAELGMKDSEASDEKVAKPKAPAEMAPGYPEPESDDPDLQDFLRYAGPAVKAWEAFASKMTKQYGPEFGDRLTPVEKQESERLGAAARAELDAMPSEEYKTEIGDGPGRFLATTGKRTAEAVHKSGNQTAPGKLRIVFTHEVEMEPNLTPQQVLEQVLDGSLTFADIGEVQVQNHLGQVLAEETQENGEGS